MTMTRDEIRDHVVASLNELIGETSAFSISERTDPINSLGLDSADGVSFACSISMKLDCYIPDEVNPFVDDERHRARLVGEIIDLVCELLAKKEIIHA